MSHDHTMPRIDDRALDRRLWLTVFLNGAITLAEVVGGVLSGSLALLSDAAHNLSDVVAVVLALWARWFARRPPTVRHTYGFKRIEVVAALVNAVMLIGATVLIGREAIIRLLDPEPISMEIMLAVGLVALAANGGSVLLLRQHDQGDVNVRSAFLHMVQDALASLAVVVAAVFARTPAGPYVDSAAALLVGLLVLHSGLSLAWRTLSTIPEGAPADVDIAEVAAEVSRVFAPASLHHIHVWEIGPSQRLLTAHVALGREMDGRAIEMFLRWMKAFLRENWSINHATLEPEVVGCEPAGLLGRWDADIGATTRSPSMVDCGLRPVPTETGEAS